MAMQSITFAQNPTVFILALLVGIVPAIAWLIFWLREEDGKRKEPLTLITITFIAGMLSVIFVLPIERFLQAVTSDHTTLIFLWASAEEIIKFLAFYAIMARSSHLDEPVDFAIYLLTAGLGFAALENAMYLIHPIAVNSAIVGVLTGNMRFLGSTLLHSVTSGLMGIAIGLAFFKSSSTRLFFGIIGLCSAIALHTIFNFFIMQNNGQNFLQVFGFLWVVTIIIMLLFERLRRLGSYIEQKPVY